MDKYFNLKSIKHVSNNSNSSSNLNNINTNSTNAKRFFHHSNSNNTFKKAKSFENHHTSKSNQDLIEQEALEQSANHYEEARLAEEALAANLKLLKKQKARFMRLQKILSRNVILIPLCAVFSVLSAALIFSSTLTDNFEFIKHDMAGLRQRMHNANEIAIEQINQILNINLNSSESNVFSHLNEKILSNLIRKQTSDSEAAMLMLMTTVASSKAHHIIKNTMIQNIRNTNTFTTTSHIRDIYHHQQQLQRLQEHQQSEAYMVATQMLKDVFIYEMSNYSSDYFVIIKRNVMTDDNSTKSKVNFIYDTYSGVWRICNNLSDISRRELSMEKCAFYRTTHVEWNEDDPGRDVIRMHNALSTCTIVCYFLLAFSWVTGLIATTSKRVPVTLATCVLNMLIAVFLLLLLLIYHRKIIAEEREINCFDLKTLFEIVCQSRTISYGYSLGLTWLALLFTFMNGVCWFHITKMQKLLFTHGFS